MSRYKITALMASFTFAFGVALVGDALAENVKCRNVQDTVKWEQINVGDEEGHLIAVGEEKGLVTNLERKPLFDGSSWHLTSLYDINVKTGVGSGQGYGETADKDGDKWYFTWEGKMLKGGRFGTGYWGGTWTSVKGTGKFEGIQGNGTFEGYGIGGYVLNDWEGDLELRR